jgi:non-specific serine/threonine protein kinase
MGLENIANLIYSGRSTRKIRFWKAENIQLDLFGNEIPVAKEYLWLYFPPLWCSTGTTKLENLHLISERIQYVGQDRN